MTTQGKLTEYAGDSGLLLPEQITSGPDNALWFTDSNDIGRINTTGQIMRFDVPGSRYGEAGYIVSGPDGNLWFSGDTSIVRMTTTGESTVFQLPHPPPSLQGLGGIAAGPDGAMWFVDPASNSVDRVTTGKTPQARVEGDPHDSGERANRRPGARANLAP
jgi:virginiamycin B lyase